MAEGQCLINIKLFDGIKQDSEDFLKQFKRLCIIKKFNEEEKLAIFPNYLSGPALAFHKTIEDEIEKWEDLEKSFLEEFPAKINYEEKFYYAKQEYSEDILEYFYRLQELAHKAKIKEDEKFIVQFLKSTTPFFKNKLSSTVLEDKSQLKKLIIQLKNIYEKTEVRATNIPTTISHSNPRTQDSPYRYGTPPEGFRRSPPVAPPRTPSRSPATAQTPTQGRNPASRHGYDLRSSNRTLPPQDPRIQQENFRRRL